MDNGAEGRTQRSARSGPPPVALREWAVVVFGGLTIAFTAWGFAGVITWSLHTLLAGGLLTFALAVLPLPARMNGYDGQHGNGTNLKRLLCFPFFWFATAFLIYITIQGLNPAWVQVWSDAGWWMEERTPPVSWLPTGVDTLYDPMNAFRMLSGYAAAFSLAAGLWVGVRRRISVFVLLWIFVGNGVAMAVVAILQRFTGAEAVLWLIESANENFWGSFFYRNQAVAYLNLILATSAALYFYYYNRAEERAQSGGPHLLLFVFCIMIATSIGLAVSRGGIIFGGFLLALFVVLVLGRWVFSRSLRGSILLSLILAFFFSAGSYYIVRNINWADIEARFGDVGESISNAEDDARALSTRATWNMAKDEWLTGYGAGSFRYIFPMYQDSFPEIYYQRYHPRMGWIGRRFYRYAHNDIVQFLAEYGVIGYSFLALAVGSWIATLVLKSSGNRLAAFMILAAVGTALAHAFLDFIFHSPAYLVAFFAMLCLVAKLLVLEHERGQRRQVALPG